MLITLDRLFGIRERHAFKPMMHPYRGREWWPDESERGEYACGYRKPNYPVPAIEYDNALAMPMEQVSFYSKRLLLLYGRYV